MLLLITLGIFYVTQFNFVGGFGILLLKFYMFDHISKKSLIIGLGYYFKIVMR